MSDSQVRSTVVNFDAIKREKKRKQIEAMYVKFYGNQYALAAK